MDTKSEARSRRSSSSAVGDRAHHHAHIFHPHKVELDSIPWCTIMKHPVVIVQMVNSFVSGWIGFMVVTQLPSYLYYQLRKCCVPVPLTYKTDPHMFNFIIIVLFLYHTYRFRHQEERCAQHVAVHRQFRIRRRIQLGVQPGNCKYFLLLYTDFLDGMIIIDYNITLRTGDGGHG